MFGIAVPVSWGEAIDKLTILSIKENRIHDNQKLLHVFTEKAELENTILPLIKEEQMENFINYKTELTKINSDLWDLEENIRIYKNANEFGEEFITTSCSICTLNDKRSMVKTEINQFFKSDIIEVKSHLNL